MNVAGAGIGGVISAIIFLLFISPFLVILIFINLGYFNSFSRTTRILRCLGLYVLALIINIHLVGILGFDFIHFFVWLLGFQLLLVLITFLLSQSNFKPLHVVRRGVGISAILVIPILYFVSKRSGPYKNELFESGIVKALDLQLVSKDSLYNAYRLVIVGDTVAGFYRGKDESPFVSSGYFIRSLRDSTFRYFFDAEGYNNFDNTVSYSDSSLILKGEHGGKLIRRMYTNGIETVYFAYKEPYFDTDDRIIYRNVQILRNRERFLIINENTRKLVFERPALALNTLLGNSLLFVEISRGKVYLHRLDLDRMKIVWSQPINEAIVTSHMQDLTMTDSVFAVKAYYHAYVFDRKTGEIKWKYRWHFPEEWQNLAMIDSNLLYVSDGAFLKSYHINTGKQHWIVKNAKIYGLHSQFVIAASTDEKWYWIIQKSSGKILNRIRRSENRMGIRFIGDYVLVESGSVTGVYK